MSDALALQLAQVRPSNSNPVSAYSPAEGLITHITRIVICNTSGAARTYRLFHDNDGTTYNETTALAWDRALASNVTDEWPTIGEAGYWMTNSSGNLAVRVDTGNGITFTFYGIEYTSN